VLRPLNVDPGAPGRGALRLPVGDEAVTVINLIDAETLTAGPAMTPGSGVPGVAMTAYQALAGADLAGTVLVDFHASSVFGKQTFAHAVDGRVAAVLGTHTHEATLPMHVLPGGTALVTDVGMTGAQGGVMGFEPEPWATGVRAGVTLAGLPAPRPVAGPCCLGAVLLLTKDGLAAGLERLS
jgi:calcineurin-like phosphoesterase